MKAMRMVLAIAAAAPWGSGGGARADGIVQTPRVVNVPLGSSFARAKDSAGGATAGTVFRLARGGSYGKVDLGAVAAGVVVEAAEGPGPLPVISMVRAYAGGRIPGFRISNLKIVAETPEGTGITLENRNDAEGTGFDGAVIEGCEISGFGLGIGVQTLKTGARHKDLVLRRNYVHDCGTAGFLIGGCQGATLDSNVGFHCGWASSRDATQSHIFYVQHLDCRNVVITNCAALDVPGNCFRGSGWKISWCFAGMAGAHYACEEMLESMTDCVGIETRDPSPSAKSGGGINADHCKNAIFERVVLAGARSTANSHALGPDGCNSCTWRDVVVADWDGDCFNASHEPTTGNSVAATFIQPDAGKQGYFNLPVPGTWKKSITTTRTNVPEPRGSMAAVYAHAGVPGARELAAWFAADPTRIRETVAWVQAAYRPAQP